MGNAVRCFSFSCDRERKSNGDLKRASAIGEEDSLVVNARPRIVTAFLLVDRYLDSISIFFSEGAAALPVGSAADSSRSTTISERVPTRSGGPPDPAPLLVTICSGPQRFRP